MPDRKELIREYKETPRPAGVYRVRNVVGGRSLLGSSPDVPAVLNRARFQLDAGLHPDKELQKDWRALGADAFVFETLDLLEPSVAPRLRPCRGPAGPQGDVARETDRSGRSAVRTLRARSAAAAGLLMHAGYAITLATAAHVVAIPDIESRAAALFAEWHVPRTVLAQTTPLETLVAAQADGRLWIAVSRAGEPVGFGLVELIETRLHLEELDVLPEHGGVGIGTALMAAIEAWARATRFREIVLTTFRDVPWNAPFYQKLGYEIVEISDLDDMLLTWLRDEGARGLDPARRVAMRKRLGRNTEISVREAGPDDATAIATIHEAAVRGPTVGACYDHTQIEAWAQPHTAPRLANGSPRAASSSRQPRVSRSPTRSSTWRRPPSIGLRASCVRAPGVGRRLTQTVFQAAREAGLERLQLDSSLNAVAFYESLGFRRLDEVDHALRSGVALRCVRMERPLRGPMSDPVSNPMRIAHLADHSEAVP